MLRDCLTRQACTMLLCMPLFVHLCKYVCGRSGLGVCPALHTGHCLAGGTFSGTSGSLTIASGASTGGTTSSGAVILSTG